jgi:hypothetical protein
LKREKKQKKILIVLPTNQIEFQAINAIKSHDYIIYTHTYVLSFILLKSINSIIKNIGWYTFTLLQKPLVIISIYNEW